MNEQDEKKIDAWRFLNMMKISEKGKLKIYIGMNAGVGKTYRMLQEAHRLLSNNVGVKIGLIETHKRKETHPLIESLREIPKREVFYRGKNRRYRMCRQFYCNIPKSFRPCTTVKNDNQRVLRILTELLNLSQAEAGKIQLTITEIDINEIIKISECIVTGTAKDRKIKIENNIKSIPKVMADADKIGRVLNNFLSNATKFSPEQTTVTVAFYEKNKRVFAEVSDEGSGMKTKYYNRIFERYFQIPGRSEKKGSGIGLSICKEMITAMNGNIWVKSEPLSAAFSALIFLFFSPGIFRLFKTVKFITNLS